MKWNLFAFEDLRKTREFMGRPEPAVERKQKK